MIEANTQKPLRYTAFISYRHADNAVEGRRWAEWMHRNLERYVVPPDLRGTANLRGEEIGVSLYPIFRDEEELPASADIAAGIEAALELSDHLIVICSPRSAVSPWVRKEVRSFKMMGRGDRILAAIIAGEPNAASKSQVGNTVAEECFCEELRFGVARVDGTIDWTATTDPLAADFRPEGTHSEGFVTAEAYREHLLANSNSDHLSVSAQVDAYRHRLELGLLKVIAGILEVPLGQVTERDAAYRADIARQELARVKAEADRLRSFNRRLRFAAAIVLFLAIAAVWFWSRAGIESERAELERAHAVDAQQRAEKEAATAIKEKQRAEREQERALNSQKRAEMEAARAAKALDAANAAASGLVGDLVAGTANWPGINPDFRTRILIRAQFVLLSALTASNGYRDKDIRRSLGIVWSELGSVKFESGEIGLASESIKSSENIFRKLLSENPSDSTILKDLTIVLHKKGEILAAQGRSREAKAVLLESLRLVGRESPLESASVHTRLGMLCLDEKGGKKEAEHHFLKANNLLKGLAKVDDSLGILRNLAASHLNLAAALDKSAAYEEIERHLKEAERLYDAIVARSRDGAADTEMMLLKMSVSSVRAETLEVHDRWGEAAKESGAAVLIGLELMRADPNNVSWAEKLANNSDHLGVSLIKENRGADAAKALRLSIGIRRKMLEISKGEADVALRFGWSLLQLGRATGWATETFEEIQTLINDLVKNKKIDEQFAAELVAEYKNGAAKREE